MARLTDCQRDLVLSFSGGVQLKLHYYPFPTED
jgi:hypothetical protein